MSSLKIRQALETAVNSMLPALATAWENVPYTPVVGTPYQKAYILFAEPENNEIASPRYRELGYLQLTLMYPLNVGTKDAQTRAELIRTAFPKGSTFAKSDVTVMVEKTPEIGTGQVDGDRWAIPVKIRFFSNVL